MPYFEYKAKNKEGQSIEGEFSGSSKAKLLEKLKNENLTPIEIKEYSDSQMKERLEEKKADKSKKRLKAHGKSGFFDRSISEQEKAFFTRQFTTMLNAGLNLDKILNILYRQTKSKKLKAIIYELGEDLQKGLSISGAMEKHPEVFDEMYISMVSVGEASGNLPSIFERLSIIIEKNLAIIKKMKAATSYPIFILVFSMILSYVLIAVFLPQFIPIFNSIGIDVHSQYPLTGLLIDLSKILTTPSYIVLSILVIAGLVFLFKMLIMSKDVRLKIDILLLKIPVINTTIIMSAMSRFCRSFSYLTYSGVSVIQSLEMLSKTVGNMAIEQAIQRIAKKVNEGSSLIKSFGEETIFPDFITQMIGVGEESGSIPNMMERASVYIDDELDNAVTSLTSMMEPAMMVVVGGIVGTFVMGILLPILTMATHMAQ